MCVLGDLVTDPEQTGPRTGPIWRQIAEDLSRQIADMDGGEKLPTEAELADRYNAGRNTVRHAIAWLEGRGLVTTGSGQRTVVAHRPVPIMTILSPHEGAGPGMARFIHEDAGEVGPKKSDVFVRIQTAPEAVRRQLDLRADDDVVRRVQEFYIGGLPQQRQTSFYPFELVGQGAIELLKDKDFEAGAVQYLRKAVGVEEVGWTDAYLVRVPDGQESEFFGVPDDGSVKVVDWIRTGYDRSGRPVRVTITTCAADRNVFIQWNGTVPEKYRSLAWKNPS
jgi:GntR family transcriptional regulator